LVEERLALAGSKMGPRTRRSVFHGMIISMASMQPDHDSKSYVDIAEGAYVTQLFIKRLEKKLFGVGKVSIAEN
jgi:hypothetical protein